MERREGTSGAFEELRNQNREAVSYADHSVDPDTIYQYRVYIGDSNGFGDYVQIQQRSEELDELTAPTDFKITYGTLNNGVYVANSPDPELEWEVGKASTGNRLTRKLIEPPAGITCQTPGDCPVMELMRQEGTRNTGYTDIYNGGGKYQYWIESIGRDGALGTKATIIVQVPSPPVPTQAAPTNVRLAAGPGNGNAEIDVTWNGHGNFPGYLVQWRRSDQANYNPDETGGRSILREATNPINMYEADGKIFRPAGTSARITYGRNANPSPWNTTYYVRVGTCADISCAIADVQFAPERSVSMGANPYSD